MDIMIYITKEYYDLYYYVMFFKYMHFFLWRTTLHPPFALIEITRRIKERAVLFKQKDYHGNTDDFDFRIDPNV